jgi:thiol-disulfide isomerase/thioredoxin
MIMQLSVVGVIILALIGCGSGTGASQSPAQKDEARTSGSVDELEQAEALRAKNVRTAPAVDTSQLRKAPDWELFRLDGQAIKSSQLQGKVVLVDFWATWCGPCKRSIPHLIDLHREYKDKGVEVIGVSVDQAGPRVVRPFVEKFAIDYPVVMGTGKVVQDFGGIRGIPTAFIISQDGKIYRKIVGLVPKERYEKDIKALLGLS